MCSTLPCCWCLRNKVIDDTQLQKDSDGIKMLNKSFIKRSEVQSTNGDENSLTLDEKPKIEDYFFGRPKKNKYYDLNLYAMPIEEIIFGIHPTIYKEKNGNFEKFSSFFLFKII